MVVYDLNHCECSTNVHILSLLFGAAMAVIATINISRYIQLCTSYANTRQIIQNIQKDIYKTSGGGPGAPLGRAGPGGPLPPALPDLPGLSGLAGHASLAEGNDSGEGKL